MLTPAGDLLQADTYNKLFTMHGMVMVFFFLIPVHAGGAGELPCSDDDRGQGSGFPAHQPAELVSLHHWRRCCILHCMLTGGVDTGGPSTRPFSTAFTQHERHRGRTRDFRRRILLDPYRTEFHRHDSPHARAGHDLVAPAAVHLGALRHQHHHDPGHAGDRNHASCWLRSSALLHLGIFDPKLGGDPLLFQHLFWFYSHPAVYIMILPSMGVISEIITCFSRKRIFGYKFVALSSDRDRRLRIPGLGASHVRGRDLALCGAGVFVSELSGGACPPPSKFSTGQPLCTRARSPTTTPMLYAFGFIGLFTIGGLTGLFLASLGIDVHVTDTYFVVAHFHYMMVGGVVMGYLGGMHFWWPKISGRMYPEGWGRLAALIVFIGFNLTFFPQFILGYLGMPRRYWQYRSRNSRC